MGVFAASTKVKRAVSDPGTDDTLPSSGSLSWGAITGSSAVAGTTGADAKLVHGDRWQQIDGNHTENIGANLLSTVTGNQTHTVTGNQTLSTGGNTTHDITGNLTTTIVGAEIRANIGVQNLSHVAPKTRLHSSPEGTQDSGSFMRAINDLEEAHIIKFDVMGTVIETDGAKFEYNGYKLEALSAESEVKLLKNGMYVLEAKECPGLKNTISAVINQLTPARNELGLLTSKAKVLEANVGAALNGDSPFA